MLSSILFQMLQRWELVRFYLAHCVISSTMHKKKIIAFCRYESIRMAWGKGCTRPQTDDSFFNTERRRIKRHESLLLIRIEGAHSGIYFRNCSTRMPNRLHTVLVNMCWKVSLNSRQSILISRIAGESRRRFVQIWVAFMSASTSDKHWNGCHSVE